MTVINTAISTDYNETSRQLEVVSLTRPQQQSVEPRETHMQEYELRTAQNTEQLLQVIKPLVHEMLLLTRSSHREGIIKILYERAKEKIQIKDEVYGINWLRVGANRYDRLPSLSVSDERVKERTGIVLSEISADLLNLFSVNVYQLGSMGNVELIFKFRDCSLVKVERIEFRRHGRCVFPEKNLNKNA
jgi:hypothetical protein